MANKTIRREFSDWTKQLQNNICTLVEKIDGKSKFHEDKWMRDEGGGGITRVITHGGVFEKGGVNTSEVYGPITTALREQLNVKGENFYACGISLVLHPFSPMIPTVHANYRYFEVYDKNGKVIVCWFGGGADLTPYYLIEKDARHFHTSIKIACDTFNKEWYYTFKKQCDNYFVNHHRNGERRGIGGFFYDYLKPDDNFTANDLFTFARANGEAFIQAYFPIVERTKTLLFNDEQKHWQLIRRGRYVEFNLIHDRGTLFGLKSNGRTESILMSLPLHAMFEYNFKPEQGSEEEKLMKILLNPVDWV